MKEGETVEANPTTSFNSPHKIRPRISRKMDTISIEEVETIRRVVYDFYLLEKRAPTLNCKLTNIIAVVFLTYLFVTGIYHKIKDLGVEFSGAKVTLWRLLKRMGFRYYLGMIKNTSSMYMNF